MSENTKFMQKAGQFTTKFSGKIAVQGSLFYQGMGEGLESSIPDFKEAKSNIQSGNEAFKRAWEALKK